MSRSTHLPVRLFCSDLDGTLLGNREASARFKSAWEDLPQPGRPILVYNSGRLVEDARRFARQGILPECDYYIGGVGTQIYDTRAERILTEFERHLDEGWDRAIAERVLSAIPGVTPQPEEFQHRHKSSWFFNNAPSEALAEIKEKLKAAGVAAAVVYSSQRDLDIIPANANKGRALVWLGQRLGLGTHEMLVAGDTDNDSSMFLLPGMRGIVVENALPELYEAIVEIPNYTSRMVMADGVLDGLRFFGVLRNVPPAAQIDIPVDKVAPSFRMLFAGAPPGTLDEDDRRLLATGYEKALVALRKNITPLGFSACSLDDNTVTGTDANYRSVWARDGAITLINTLDVDDPELRAAHRRTLETLLNAASPAGQIPANVRIDDGKPDYAGVGNICSIDSGLWIIIAVYNYVLKTADMDLLQRYEAVLQRAMNWLSAHDSNSDGLLEIPEAGDWTDIFGRSYNVLYDEVLWYRAHVCFGRLREFLGDYETASVYLRSAKLIRSRVLEAFWPSTAPVSADARPRRFSDQQFALGDTQYLLAEITPFAFNWRCDVFGNILAFLMNLLDVERARTAFRFMWGAGVNEPWPVANLYPVVQAGDPDWRPYYTVNLLNLPKHYHNGGIWPFIGGMWVRYIHRLGFRDVACRELVKLAKLNQLGRDHEWEFNEWAHGGTGRPMGKAFQAWSAASFIRACQEVEADPEHLVVLKA